MRREEAIDSGKYEESPEVGESECVPARVCICVCIVYLYIVCKTLERERRKEREREERAEKRRLMSANNKMRRERRF